MRTRGQWRKSSFSNGNGGACVEVALDAVRDSKNPNGGVLRTDLTALLATVKSGRLTR